MGETTVKVENLNWDERAMQRALLMLPSPVDNTEQLRLFDSYSKAHLQARLDKTLAWMNALGYEVQASEIDKIVGEEPDPVWRVVITYRYEPYHFWQLPLPGPSF